MMIELDFFIEGILCTVKMYNSKGSNKIVAMKLLKCEELFKIGFNTENRDISDLFQRPCRYVVPRYQRDYVWKEINWNELITDIKFTMNVNEDISWSHFLGTIVLSNYVPRRESENIRGITDYEIIDGQQRLTTVYFVFIAIYRQFLIIDTEESRNRAQYIFDTFITSLAANSERHLVIKNADFEADIAEIVDLAKEKGMPAKGNKYYKMYNYFCTDFRNLSFIEMDNFLNKLLDINIVEIVSGQEEEIYNIFEVLNARGQKLKQIELLKNHIMKYVQPREEAFIDSAKLKWKEIMENGSRLSDVDHLINHFSKSYIKKNAENATSVYRLIKEEIHINNLTTLLTDLHNFSRIYKVVTDNDTSDDVIEYFNIKRNQQIRSLLASISLLVDRSIISEKDKKISFRNIRNFFFIFNATQQTSNKTDDIVGNTSYKVYHCNDSVHFKFIMSDFFDKVSSYLNEDNFRSTFYTNQSFRYSTQDSSLKRNSRLVKYTLQKYCEFFQTDTTLDSRHLTIEHLFNDNGYTDNSLLYNLTLTNETINSNELKDKNIEEKVEILSTRSSILVNRNLNVYLEESTFHQEQRKEDILNMLYSNVFKFDKEIFHITKSDLIEFEKQKNIVKNSEKLSNLLNQTGKNFVPRLNNDTKLLELLAEYELLIESF